MKRMDDVGVSPVIGSLLILAVTVMGMTAVIVWGAPAVQRAQSEAAQDNVVEELRDLRRRALTLSVPDASRVPVVRLGSGEFSSSDGDPILIQTSMDPSNVDCEFRITNWGDGDDTFNVDLTGCRVATTAPCVTCLTVEKVNGGVLADVTETLVVNTVTLSESMADSDWRIRINDATTTYAEAWIIHTGRLSWEGPDGLKASLEGGAVFTSDGNTQYLLERPAFQENAFGTNDYLLRLPTTRGDDAVQGQGDYQFYMGLTGIHTRTDTTTAYTLRIQGSGEYAEGWCNTFLIRNQDVAGTPYVADDGCTANDPSVRYRLVQPPSSDPGNAAFSFEFIHVDLATSLII